MTSNEEIIDKTKRITSELQSFEPKMAKLKEIRQMIQNSGVGPDVFVLILERIVDTIDDLFGAVVDLMVGLRELQPSDDPLLFQVMVMIRELQLGSDPGGPVPPGKSLMDLHRRLTDLEARAHDPLSNISLGVPTPSENEAQRMREGRSNLLQLASAIRTNSDGFDIADERDRAILWAADQIHALPVEIVGGRLARIGLKQVETKEERMKQVDGQSELSVDFQDVLETFATLRLADAEEIWHMLAKKPETRMAAEFFAKAVNAAVGLQSDLKKLVKASANEANKANELRDGLQQVSKALTAAQQAEFNKDVKGEEKHLREALAKVAKLLLD